MNELKVPPPPQITSMPCAACDALRWLQEGKISPLGLMVLGVSLGQASTRPGAQPVHESMCGDHRNCYIPEAIKLHKEMTSWKA
jgi:hypothetical protein